MNDYLPRIASTLIVLALSNDLSLAGTPKKTEPNPVRATKFEIKEGETSSRGRLYVTVDEKEKKIADAVSKAWLINDDREIVYSRRKDGAGGFENDGESLRIYNFATGNTRKILSEYFAVDAVMETKVGKDESALLVRMSDGASFVSYFAVVNPKRGEVLYRASAELTEIKGDEITLAFYGDADWDAIREERVGRDFEPDKVILPQPKIAPAKIETHDLKEVLRRKVIYNKPTNTPEDTEPKTSA
jgi:hypothetical protein